MKKTILMAAALLAVGFSYGQQTIKSENLSEFNSISLTGNLVTELIESDVNKIDIVLYDAEITAFKWSVQNGTLQAQLNSGRKASARADIKIYYNDALHSISISGGELMAAAPIKSEIFKFSANGGAKVTVGFESLDLELKITGNSVGHFSGYAKYMTLSATEKSKVDARPIECVSADVEAATGAEAYVTISERLVANAKSTSSIFYRGTPVIIKDMTSKMSSGMMGSGLHYIGVKE